jgi:hypothetical protein
MMDMFEGMDAQFDQVKNKVFSVLFYSSCIAFELRYFQTASYLSSSLSQNKGTLTNNEAKTRLVKQILFCPSGFQRI